MLNDEITVDITYKALNQEDVKIVASAQDMYSFIHEWKERMREAVKYSTLEGEAYDAVEKLRNDFYESMSEHKISELF